MPSQIINTSNELSGFELCLFESLFAFEAEGEITSGLKGVFESRFRFEAEGVTEYAALAEFESQFEFVANGFLNAEPNITDEAIFESSFEFEGQGTFNYEALAIFGSSFKFEAKPHFVPAPEYRVSVTLHILPTAAANGAIRVWQPRLLVDGVKVPIISWSAPDGEESVGEKLSVVLQRWPDKALFTSGSVINFGIGKKVNGVWDAPSFITLLSGGNFQISSHSVRGEPSNAADRVTISVSGNLAKRLNTRPASSFVIYDGTRIEQRPEFYQNEYDQNGSVYSTALIDIPGLNLGSLMGLILGQSGLSVSTNLPSYPIVQAYFPLGERLWDGLKRYTGVFDPIVYQTGTTIGIMDSTLMQPSGFPDAEILEVDSITNLDVQDDRSNRFANAVRIRFIHNIEDYDVVSSRTDPPIEEPDGDNLVLITRSWREYSKSSQPYIPLREELVSELRETFTPDEVMISASEETYTYTATHRQASRTQVISSWHPDMEAWRVNLEAAEAAARAENPSITDDEIETLLDAIEPPYVFGEITREAEIFTHSAYPIQALDGAEQRYYVRSRGITREGLILVNNTDKHLGKAFKQEFQPAVRSGNITRDTTSEYGPIKSTTELGEPVAGGLVNYTTMTTDHLLPKDQVFVNYSQQRPGDIGSGQFRTSEITRIIRGGGPIEGIEDFHFGELPPEVSIPLALRYVNSGLKSPRTILAEYAGYRKEIAPGSIRRLTWRDGTMIGTFIVLSRTPFGDADGTFTRLTCREV